MGAATISMLHKHLSMTILLMTMIIAGAVVADAAEATFCIRGDANRNNSSSSSTGDIPCKNSSGDRCLVADYAEEFLPMDLGTSRMLADKNDDESTGYAAVFEASLQAVRPCDRGVDYGSCLPPKNKCTKRSKYDRHCTA